MSQQLLRREVVVAGVRLSCLEREVHTAAGKPPLLLLHGLLASAELFTDLIEHLPTDRRVIALDLLAAKPLGEEASFDVSFVALSELVVAFAAATGLEQPVLLGHSHGGALALRLATSHPKLLNGLILLCPAHPFGGYDESVVRFYGTRLGRSLAHLVPWLPRPMLRSALSRMAAPKQFLEPRQVELYRSVLRSRLTVPRVLRMLRTWQSDMGALRKAMLQSPLETPTLLLWGDCDPVVLVRSADALERCLRTEERFTLPGVGHLITDESPLECARMIRTWLIWRETHPRYTHAAR